MSKLVSEECKSYSHVAFDNRFLVDSYESNPSFIIFISCSSALPPLKTTRVLNVL